MNVGENKTHVGIINYSDLAEIVTSLNTDYTLDQKLQRLNHQVKHFSVSAFTHLGLQQALDIFSSARGLRQPEEGVMQVLFLITHHAGGDQNAANQAAQVLKARGIHLITVGVGSSLNLKELHAICTLPETDNCFQITNNVAVEQKLNQITSRVCSEPVIIMPNSTIIDEVDVNKYKFLKIKIDIIGNKILITVILVNGNVKLFFSFTNRNPKDPDDFRDYSSYTTIDQKSFRIKSKLHDTVTRNRARNDENKEITLLIDVPQTKPEFVYVGVKGTDINNKFQVRFDDCANIDCKLNSLSSSTMKLNMLLLFVAHLPLLLKVFH
ncbi:unnamed protein product [Rotaria sp. Silwood2]|nr:unnamed protein product [Rotaria sp. Silwood2]